MRAALNAHDPQVRERALYDLRTFVGRTLQRAFRGQLSDADLEDLTQESVVKVLQRMSSFRQQSRFTTWVAVIAVHQGISELRRKRLQHVTLEAAAAQAAAELCARPHLHTPGTADAASLERLQRGLQEALTERQREALLARLGGVPLMEIARRHGTTAGAVYKMVHDARIRLRSYMTDVGHGE